MSKQEPLRISVVLPVYNEAADLAACLRALASQTVAPYEVIVVDNNSTDLGPEIAREFPFVRLLTEHKQGVVYARTTGFNAARGDIIGRLDADSIVPSTWVADVQRLFADETLAAVTGRVTYRDIACVGLINTFDLHFRRYFARVLGPEVALQGANMAMRQGVWREVRGKLCGRGGQHEDFDLAIHTSWAGFRVAFDESLAASISARQVGQGWHNFVTYMNMSPKTYGQHGLKSKRYMYLPIVLVAVCYPVLAILRRGYDTKAGHFTAQNLLANAAPVRVNPALFVD